MDMTSDSALQRHSVVLDSLPGHDPRDVQQEEGQNPSTDDQAHVQNSPAVWQKAAKNFSTYLDRSGLNPEKQSELIEWLYEEQQAVKADDFLELSLDMDMDAELAFSAVTLLEYARQQEAMVAPPPTAADLTEVQTEQQIFEVSSGGEAALFGVAALVMKAAARVRSALSDRCQWTLAHIGLAIPSGSSQCGSRSVRDGHEPHVSEIGSFVGHLGHQPDALQGNSPSAADGCDVSAGGSRSLGASGGVQKLGAEGKQPAVARSARSSALGGA